jgi:alpha-glucosidase
LLYVPWDADEVRRRVAAAEAAIPNGGWPNHVLGNHDETRLASRFGADRARAAAMLLLTLRGTPTMYYGDELAMPNTDIAPADERDPWGLRVPGQGRDGCRTPMQWASGPRAGFTDADAEPWLPLGPSAATRNVAAELDRPRSILQLYRRLLDLRRSEPALQVGTYRARNDAPPGVYLYERSHAKRTAVVAINFSDRPCTIDLGDAELMLSTELDREPTSGSIEMRPNEGLIAFRPKTP